MKELFPLYDENRPLRKPYVNYALIAVNVIVFFYFFFQGLDALYYAFIVYGAIPAEILRGKRLWTLFTSMFMHGDISHILGNMVFLYIFGDNIEDTFGHAKYLLFYLAGGLVADFAHIASTLLTASFTSVHPFTPDLYVPCLGASGAISAVLGAYFLLFPRARIRTLVFYGFIWTIARVPAFYYLGFWFLYQLLMGFGALLGAPSTVAFWAHIGGYVYGMTLVKFLSIKPRKPLLISQEKAVRPIVSPWVITPLVDVFIEEDRLIIMANMPGVDERAIEVKVSEWEVEISAKYRDIKFYRLVTLPVPVIPKVQNPIYRNGVLTFTLYRAN